MKRANSTDLSSKKVVELENIGTYRYNSKGNIEPAGKGNVLLMQWDNLEWLTTVAIWLIIWLRTRLWIKPKYTKNRKKSLISLVFTQKKWSLRLDSSRNWPWRTDLLKRTIRNLSSKVESDYKSFFKKSDISSKILYYNEFKQA